TEVFIRVEADGCADLRSVIITFNSNPVVNNLENQAFCSEEISGTIAYDLTQHEPEWVNEDPAGYIFSYHLSQNDADLDHNSIFNPDSYQIPVGTTTEIYVRIENPDTDCYTITILTLYPGTTATLLEDLEIALCDENFRSVYIFNLTELNGQLIADPGTLDFQYFTSLSDANNNVNPIPQTQWNNYAISSLPYELWVVATTTDECRSEPVNVNFVQGDSINLLNDVIGPVQYCIEDVINLHEYEQEITNEEAIFSYHNSLNDAENGLNPINDAGEFLPEGNNSVYVRLEMEGRCPVIVEIRFELLSTPSIELNETSF